MNRRQRRAEEAHQRRARAEVLPGEPVCTHERADDGRALGCPHCFRFEVRAHPVEDGDYQFLACCWCGARFIVAYREHAPQQFLDFADAEVARLEAGGAPPPGYQGREAYAAQVSARRQELVALRARERAWAATATETQAAGSPPPERG